MKSYLNVFEGYTTQFNVYDVSGDPPGISHECIIRFENVSPIEIVIPYFRTLEPSDLERDLGKILERAEDLTYEEYPFRSITEEQEYANVHVSSPERDHGTKSVYVYWHPKDSRARVRVLSNASEYIEALNAGIEYHHTNLQRLEENILGLLKTLQY